jgi:hypothetical protein
MLLSGGRHAQGLFGFVVDAATEDFYLGLDVSQAGSEIDANSCAGVRTTRCGGGSQGEKVPDGGASGQKVRNPDAPG